MKMRFAMKFKSINDIVFIERGKNDFQAVVKFPNGYQVSIIYGKFAGFGANHGMRALIPTSMNVPLSEDCGYEIYPIIIDNELEALVLSEKELIEKLNSIPFDCLVLSGKMTDVYN